MRIASQSRTIWVVASAALPLATIAGLGACNSKPAESGGESQKLDTPPTVAELVYRHIEAIGGRDALEKIKTRRESARTTYSFDDKLIANWTDEVSGSRRVWDWRYSDGRHVRSGFDGQTAWHIKDGQSVVMTGEDHDRTAYFSRLDHFLQWDSLHRESTLIGVEKFYGVDSYAVNVVAHNDLEFKHYFSIESGLHCGIAYSEPGRNGRIHIERLLSDYRPVGDILVAHRGDSWYRESKSGNEWHTTDKALNIQLNVSFPEGHFDLPPEVLRAVDRDREDESDDVSD